MDPSGGRSIIEDQLSVHRTLAGQAKESEENVAPDQRNRIASRTFAFTADKSYRRTLGRDGDKEKSVTLFYLLLQLLFCVLCTFRIAYQNQINLSPAYCEIECFVHD